MIPGVVALVELDSYTVLIASSAGLTCLGCALLFFWNRDRRLEWLLWWSLPFILGGLSALAYTRQNWSSDFLSIGPGNVARMLAVAMLWQGARAFAGRKPLWLALVAIPVVWLGLCLVPAFFENMPARIVVVSAAQTGFCLLAAWELWRGRDERLPSRYPAIACFVSFAAVMLVRILGVNVLPFPMGSLPLDPVWLGGFNLTVFAHAFFVGLLLLALTKERLELEQRNIALVDPLTGLMNRRAFMAQVERNAVRRGLGPEPTAILVLDLDHFKSINDEYGHEIGDRVLASFAAVAAANVRPSDMLYRLGGEEFCIVLPHSNVHVALSTSERVRKAFASHTYVSAGGIAIAATVSIGIATADHAGFDLDVLLAAADAALYEAKSRGRNRIVVADPQQLVRPAAEIVMEAQRVRAAGA
jgi:diguanylate cyclase (GGDEF)-like protein